MKAISIKEPWASMIRRGQKTIETRTWKTNYRGPLLLCCSLEPHMSVICGLAFATARLVDCRQMTQADQRKAGCKMYPRAKSWVLQDIKAIKPFPVRGQQGLFNVKMPEETK